jgi:hypothetical protein
LIQFLNMPAKLKLKRLTKIIKKDSPDNPEAAQPVSNPKDAASQDKVPEPPVKNPDNVTAVSASAPETSATPTPQTETSVSQPTGTAPTSAPASDLPSVSMDQEVPLEKRNNRIYLVGIIITAIVLLVTGVVLYLKITQPVSAPQTVTPQVVEDDTLVEIKITPAPVATSEAKLTLEILNGSGVAGAAGRIADTFVKLGYIIVGTGNADSQTGNSLLINEKQKSQNTNSLLKDMSTLKISSVSGYFTDSTASARIILGKE